MSNPLAVEPQDRSNDRSDDRIAQQHRIEHTAVSAALGWSGWGSPIGLGLFVVAVGFFVLCLHWAGIVH